MAMSTSVDWAVKPQHKQILLKYWEYDRGGHSHIYPYMLKLNFTPVKNWHSGSVVEFPLCEREVSGSIPGRVIPKTLKMLLAALSFGAQH